MRYMERLDWRGYFASVSPNPIEWQPMAVDFVGPTSGETNSSPNPFLDLRLQVTFTHTPTGETYAVPGYFDGDGQGNVSGNGVGNVWRVKFTPDEPGQWTYRASFRSGANVAVSLDPVAGTATSFDGEQGSFTVAPRNPNAPGFLATGRLEYVGGHYLKYRDGDSFVKTGVNSPENFLSFADFDNTPAADYGYAAHVADWQPGDPTWDGGRGKGIVGALNYLSGKGVNSVYFLPMNIGGDGRDVWPYAGPIHPAGSTSNDNTHFDLSKMAQWNTVFEHAQRKGVHLHFVLNEAEGPNKRELDNATLGNERKLFYRELVARFGHLNSLQWNISEEYEYDYSLSPDRVKEFASYVQNVDPYDHPITVHQQGNRDRHWTPFLGDSRFSLTSFQSPNNTIQERGADIELWRNKSAAAGRPLAINLDEGFSTNEGNQASQRKQVVWPVLMSGGGMEVYAFERDRELEDFRVFDDLYTSLGHARRFVSALPVATMTPNDGLVTGENTSIGGAQVFVLPGEVYAAYFPNASATGTLNLSGVNGRFEGRWYNPRTGLFTGNIVTVQGGSAVSLGAPPADAGEDWAIVLRRDGTVPVDFPAAPTGLSAVASGAGQIDLTWADASNNESGFVIERSFDGITWTQAANVGGNSTGHRVAGLQPGTPYSFRVAAYNSAGASGYSNTATASTPATPGVSVIGLTLINATTGQPIMQLVEGSVIDFAALGTDRLSVRAETTSNVGSVDFGYDDDADYRVENSAPYAINGDTDGRYDRWTPSLGAHTLFATPSTADNGGGTVGPTLAVNFTVVNGTPPPPTPQAPAAPTGMTATPLSASSVRLDWVDRANNETAYELYRAVGNGAFALLATLGNNAVDYTDTNLTAGTSYSYRVRAVNAAGPSAYSATAVAVTPDVPADIAVVGFTLFNALTDEPIMQLVNGSVIDFAALGTNKINIRADVSGLVASVRFRWDGNSNFRTENSDPYSIVGDSDGDYKPWTPSRGVHTLGATAYSADNARGTASRRLEISIKVR